MSLLYRIIYAAHAKGTHHKLALDALAHISGPDAEAWRRLFLKHAEGFMAGAKAPDDVFKDFKNHVLHPRDKFWGGAPATARLWYDKTVTAFVERKWVDAVHAAGILSHYVTDAVHPFHTGQSEAENSIHRAFEWSTAKSYDALKAVAPGGAIGAVEVPDRSDWLEEMLRAGATRANGQYEKLIAHYDINRGVVDPPAGLDVVAQRIVGDLILYASRLFGVILGRALQEAKVKPPEVSLAVDTVLATLKIPIKMLAKRLADRADRALVERMYDELRATGTVEHSLPEDDRAVRELYATEVLRGSLGLPSIASAEPVPRVTPIAETPAFVSLASRLAAETPPAPVAEVAAAAPASTVPKPEPDQIQPHVAKSEGAPPANANTVGSGSVPSVRPRPVVRSGGRPRLRPSDDVVDAPSVGPRMAERLRPLGILTVQDLLDEEPGALAKSLAVSYVTADVVAEWQAQAQLVCTVPDLSGTGAQLLVGAGYRNLDSLAEGDSEKLCADLLAFAATDKGRRILRDGDPPNVERIKSWAQNAKLARAA